ESPAEEGILDGKRKAAFKVIYAARRAFVQYNAAVCIQKVVRGTIVRMRLERRIQEIAEQAALEQAEKEKTEPPLPRPAEMVPFRPYYEQHFCALGPKHLQ
ncbi:unnamed protein product, partial [Cladocopium goreaui]